MTSFCKAYELTLDEHKDFSLKNLPTIPSYIRKIAESNQALAKTDEPEQFYFTKRIDPRFFKLADLEQYIQLILQATLPLHIERTPDICFAQLAYGAAQELANLINEHLQALKSTKLTVSTSNKRLIHQDKVKHYQEDKRPLDKLYDKGAANVPVHPQTKFQQPSHDIVRPSTVVSHETLPSHTTDCVRNDLSSENRLPKNDLKATPKHLISSDELNHEQIKHVHSANLSNKTQSKDLIPNELDVLGDLHQERHQSTQIESAGVKFPRNDASVHAQSQSASIFKNSSNSTQPVGLKNRILSNLHQLSASDNSMHAFENLVVMLPNATGHELHGSLPLFSHLPYLRLLKRAMIDTLVLEVRDIEPAAFHLNIWMSAFNQHFGKPFWSYLYESELILILLADQCRLGRVHDLSLRPLEVTIRALALPWNEELATTTNLKLLK